jgi:hypothetical protein
VARAIADEIVALVGDLEALPDMGRLGRLLVARPR